MRRFTGAKEQEQSMVTRGEPATKAWGQGIPAPVAERTSTNSTKRRGAKLDAPGTREAGSPHIPHPACTLAGWSTQNPGAAEVLRKVGEQASWGRWKVVT